MKRFFFHLFIIHFTFSLGHAQIFEKLKKKAEKSVEKTLERRIEKETQEKTDDVLDEVFEKEKETPSTRNQKTSTKTSTDHSIIEPPEDQNDIIDGSHFFPDGNILFYEDFKDDTFGDFPLKWETNSGGEVIQTTSSKALKLYPNGIYMPQINQLPENYALEFDLVTANLKYKGLSGSQFGLTFSNQKTLNKAKSGGKFGFSLWKESNICNQITIQNWGKVNIKIDNNIPYKIEEKLNTTTHFTIVVNKTRLRIYIDNEKTIDLPSFLNNDLGKYIQFFLKGTNAQENHLVAISNIKITEEGEDIRSLLLKGGFSTTKILFDSGSDRLKSDSYLFLDKMAKILQEDTNIRLNIIGHTDNEGDQIKNMTLSKSRAANVMNYFVDKKGLNKSRFMFQGRGENEPIADNKTEEGKAKNRRVEFQKM